MPRLNAVQRKMLRADIDTVQELLLTASRGLPIWRAHLGAAALAQVTAMVLVGRIVEHAVDSLHESALEILRSFWFLLHDEPSELRDRIEAFLEGVDALADLEQ